MHPDCCGSSGHLFPLPHSKQGQGTDHNHVSHSSSTLQYCLHCPGLSLASSPQEVARWMMKSWSPALKPFRPFFFSLLRPPPLLAPHSCTSPAGWLAALAKWLTLLQTVRSICINLLVSLGRGEMTVSTWYGLIHVQNFFLPAQFIYCTYTISC